MNPWFWELFPPALEILLGVRTRHLFYAMRVTSRGTPSYALSKHVLRRDHGGRVEGHPRLPDTGLVGAPPRTFVCHRSIHHRDTARSRARMVD